jgi:hypothetical protein
MTEENLLYKIEALFRSWKAHHEAFIKTDSTDPECLFGMQVIY